MSAKYKYLKGRMGVDPRLADLAEELIGDEPGATVCNVVELAEEFQLAFEEAAQEIEATQQRKVLDHDLG